MLQVHFHIVVTDDLFLMQVHFYLRHVSDVAETCELMEMPAEGISCMIQGFIARADEGTALDEIVSFVEGRSGEVFVYWVDLEPLEGVDGSDGVLPHVTHHVVEVATLEEIDGIGRHPVLHVDVADRLVLPGGLVLLQGLPDRVVLVLGGQTDVGVCFLRFPLAEGAGFQVVNLNGPVPGHRDDIGEGA